MYWQKRAKGFQFSRLLSHEVFQSSSEAVFGKQRRGCVTEQVFFNESAIIRHLQRERFCFRVYLPLLKTTYFSVQMFTQTRNNRKTTMWLSSVQGKEGGIKKIMHSSEKCKWTTLFFNVCIDQWIFELHVSKFYIIFTNLSVINKNSLQFYNVSLNCC